MPNGPAGVNPDVLYKVTGNDGSVSGLPERTRENVEADLLARHAPAGILPHWGGKRIKPTVQSGIDATQVTSGTFADSFVPSVGQLRDAIYQAFTGTSLTNRSAAQVQTAISDWLDDYATWKADITSRVEALEAAL
ncbi:hypothetical protein [Mycobacterium sp. PSTR-4-N]|uniref:hypothetical protein n=1 Tax=Mycobacterium sp. PSTR-4-N TaxID=2917745 RepID=UPI001F14C7E1|nr:hypothetical protein [Mycobacterium sp. PSTR-4-N]MCG7592379.1 hypothetical protein [Mycobacterium sp. PSTR-4-N]